MKRNGIVAASRAARFLNRFGESRLGRRGALVQATSAQMLFAFRDAFKSAVKRIEANPRQFPLTPHQTRKALVRRFPYLVLFRETDHAAYVVAVFHTRRDPQRR